MPVSDHPRTADFYRELGARPAPIRARIVAAAIDLLLLFVVATVDFLVFGVVLLDPSVAPPSQQDKTPAFTSKYEVGDIALLVAPVAAFWLWNHVVRVARGGASIGMSVAGVQLMSARTGSAPSMEMALLRALLAIFFAAPLGFGMLPVLAHPEHRGLHDRAAGLVVVDAPD